MTEPSWLIDLGAPLDRGPGPEPEQARRRVRHRRAARLGAVGVVTAVVLLLWPGDLTPRGAPAAGTIVLEAAAEDASGLRALADGAAVSSAERVVFRLSTSTAGRVTLSELAPEGGEISLWRGELGPGSHAVQADGTVLSYRPDGRPGPRRYLAEWCPPSSGDCTTDILELSWSP